MTMTASTSATLAELLQQGDDARELIAYRRIDADRDAFAVAYYGIGGGVYVATIDVDSPTSTVPVRPVRLEARLGQTFLTTISAGRIGEALEERQAQELELAAGAARFTVTGAATGRVFAVDVDVAEAARCLSVYRTSATQAELEAELAELDLRAELRTDEHAAGIVITRIR